MLYGLLIMLQELKTELASVNDTVNGIQFVGKSNTNTVATINVH